MRALQIGRSGMSKLDPGLNSRRSPRCETGPRSRVAAMTATCRLTSFIDRLLNDARIDFFAMHRDAFGGVDSQADLIPFHAHYCHRYLVTDHERFANAPGEY